MAVRIFCNEKEILFIKNNMFGLLYDTMESLIEKNQIILNSSLKEAMDALYVGSDGIGTDIAYYLKESEDIFFFAELIKESIEYIKIHFPDLSNEILIRYWHCYHEVIIYGQKVNKHSDLIFFYNNDKILEIDRLVFETIGNYVRRKIHYNKIEYNENISDLFKMICDKDSSIIINLSDDLKLANDVSLFSQSIKDALEEIERWDLKLILPDQRTKLWNFYKFLIDIN